MKQERSLDASMIRSSAMSMRFREMLEPSCSSRNTAILIYATCYLPWICRAWNLYPAASAMFVSGVRRTLLSRRGPRAVRKSLWEKCDRL